MDFTSKHSSIDNLKASSAVVFLSEKSLLQSAGALDELLDGQLTAQLKNLAIGKEAGSHVWISPPSSFDKAKRVLLMQIGKSEHKSEHRLSNSTAVNIAEKLASALVRTELKDATIFLDDIALGGKKGDPEDPARLSAIFSRAFGTAVYRYGDTKKLDDKGYKLAKVTLAASGASLAKTLKKGLEKGRAQAEGINFARHLGNLPPNICTPKYLTEQAKKLASTCSKLNSKALNEKQMEKLGMGAFLSVSKGSDEEGQLIIMEYKGKKADKSKPYVLVGKGITFDTGGISLKPGPAMDEMKFDMCGAASVFGVMKAVVEMDADIHLICIVAAAENMPSGRASKPGDVVTSMSGQTIEILNTDAEGRLVLCDALSYAERYKPKAVIDVATLTGACVIALGSQASGLYSNDQGLADELLKAGELAADRAWQMPLWDGYQKQLDSNFADMANIGGREAGSVTAACFLSRYTKKMKWAHLDIAGTAWKSGSAKGASGRPVGLLLQYLLP